MQRIAGKIVLGLCASSLMWGCGDALPPSPGNPGTGVAGTSRLVFSKVLEGKFWSDNAVVMVKNSDGSGETRIAPGTIVGRPGLNRIAFLRDDSVFVATWKDGAWDIIHIPHTPINGGDVDKSSVALSPDGRFLTFTTRVSMTSDADRIDTYLASADGAGNGLPLPVGLANGFTPIFSRDSRKMAFHGVPTTSNNSFKDSGKIYVFNTDGSGYKGVADLEQIGADGGVCHDFSPDGTRIVYTAQAPGTELTTLYVANTNGSGSPRKLMEPGTMPAWSPDGRTIYYVGGLNYDIMAIHADGSGTPANLTNTAGVIEGFPQISPDGKKIACTVFPGDPERYPGAIRVFDVADPSNMITLTDNGYIGFWLRTDP
jgi:hypothetical protein